MSARTDTQTLVLLSFSRAYADVARQLKSELNAANIDVRLDQWEGGGGVPSVAGVNTVMQDVDFLIPLLTPSDATATWITKQWQHSVYDRAVALDIDVLPVLGETGMAALPDFLGHLSCADLSDHNKHEGWRLIKTIRDSASNPNICLPDNQQVQQPTNTALSITLELPKVMWPQFVNNDAFLALHQGLFYELGVKFPPVTCRTATDDTFKGIRLLVNDIPEAEVEVGGDENQVFICLSNILRLRAPSFITTTQTRQMLAQLETTWPQLVAEAVPPAVPLFVLTDVLRRLVAEGLSIRNLQKVLTAVVYWARIEPSALFLTEYVRAQLKREISYRYGRGENQIVVLLLHPDLEALIEQSTQYTMLGCYIDLKPERISAILNAIGQPLERLGDNVQMPVILTPVAIRSTVRRLVAPTLPTLDVLSYQELNPNINIQPLGQISLDGFIAR